MRRVMMAVVAVAGLAGCAGGSDPIGSRLEALDDRNLDLTSQDGRIAAIDHLAPLTDSSVIGGGGNNGQRVLSYITDHPPMPSSIYEDVMERTRRCKYVNCATSSIDISNVLLAGKLITEAQAKDVFNAADSAVADAILSGRYDGILDNAAITRFPSTKRPDVERKLAINLFDALPGFGGDRQKQKQELLSAYISRVQDRDGFLKELEDRLRKKGHIKASDLDGAYRFLFPYEVEKMVAGRRKLIVVTSSPSRRLVEEDVKAALEVDRDVKVVEPGTQGATVIEIRELEVRERESPPSRRTQIISSVDVLTAALLLPQNATVMVDVIEGSAEVEYAYEVEIRKPKERPFVKLLRDRISNSSRTCENLRYQNVFGGVGPLGVWPNSQIETYCKSGFGSVELSAIRRKIPRIIADSIIPLL